MTRVLIALLAVLALAGCAQSKVTSEERKYNLCVQAGGTWIDTGGTESCILPRPA